MRKTRKLRKPSGTDRESALPSLAVGCKHTELKTLLKTNYIRIPRVKIRHLDILKLPSACRVKPGLQSSRLEHTEVSGQTAPAGAKHLGGGPGAHTEAWGSF